MRSGGKAILLFSTGEVSPLLAGRTDLEKVEGAARILQNMVLKQAGPAQRRAGTQYVASAKGVAGSSGALDSGIGLWEGSVSWDDPWSDTVVTGVFSVLVEHVSGTTYSYIFSGTLSSNSSINPWQMRLTRSSIPTETTLCTLDKNGAVISGALSGTFTANDPLTENLYFFIGDPTVGFGAAGDTETIAAILALAP